MNDQWLEYAMKIQAIAQAGLTYGKDAFDLERYQVLREIAAEMLALKADVPVEKVRALFCNEEGYQTPKIDTRAAVLVEGKILLVRERNGTWALPGGWYDVDESIASNVVKEVAEETGCVVAVERLIAVHDWRVRNVQNFAHGVMKVFVLCAYESGTFKPNIETTEIGFFERDALPSLLANEKTTEAQIHMCFDTAEDPEWRTQFD